MAFDIDGTVFIKAPEGFNKEEFREQYANIMNIFDNWLTSSTEENVKLIYVTVRVHEPQKIRTDFEEESIPIPDVVIQNNGQKVIFLKPDSLNGTFGILNKGFIATEFDAFMNSNSCYAPSKICHALEHEQRVV